MLQPRTIRIFISSTFKDMHSERDYLVKFIFPELRERCVRKGLSLVDVDLRWGVSQEEAEQGKAIEICLDEIENCRPFFIGILGERYGWTPDTYQVPNYEQYDWLKKFEKGHSVTALEIYHGVLNQKEMHPRAFFYFRNPGFVNNIPESKLLDVLAETPESAKKLYHLKDDIRDTFNVYKIRGHVTENYPCQYKGLKINWKSVKIALSHELNDEDICILEKVAGVDNLVENDEFATLNEKQRNIVEKYSSVFLDGLENFGNQVLTDLWKAIDEEYPDEETEIDPVLVERSCHIRFMDSRTRMFIGREDIIGTISRYICNAENHKPLLITGEPGSGKSAVIAIVAKKNMASYNTGTTVVRFIGASPDSLDINKLVPGIIREIASHFLLIVDESRIEDQHKLYDYFKELLFTAGNIGGLFLFIDALNQLKPVYDPCYLTWLPKYLPGNVKIVLSSIEDEFSKNAVKYELPVQIVENLSVENSSAIIQNTLGEFRKPLSKQQIESILTKTDATKPLYLKLACEELRVFSDFNLLNIRIGNLPETIPDLFAQLLQRLEADHNPDLVKDTMCLVECSMYGLLESELLELLKPADKEKLPLNTWARLYRNIAPYLLNAGDNKEGLLNFFHLQLSYAIRERYLKDKVIEKYYYKKLSDYGLGKYNQKNGDTTNTILFTGIYLYKTGDEEALFKLLEDIFTTDIFTTDNITYNRYKEIADILYNWVTETYDFKIEKLLISITEKLSKNEQPYQFCKFLNKKGSNLERYGNLTWALALLDNSRTIMGSILASQPNKTYFIYELSSIYNNIGIIYKALGNSKKALEIFEKEIVTLENLLQNKSDNQEFSSNLSVCYHNVGNIYKDFGETNKALGFFKKQRETLEILLITEPQNNDIRRELALSFNNIGNINKALGNSEIALGFFEKQKEILESILLTEPYRKDILIGLSVCLNDIGNIYKLKGDTKKAFMNFESQKDKLESLLLMEPKDIYFLKELSLSFHNLGNILKNIGNTNEAIKFFEKQKEILTLLITVEPDSFYVKRDISINYNNLGNIYNVNDDSKKALELFEKSFSIGDELVKMDPRRVDLKYDLCITCNNIGNIYLSAGLLKQAMNIFEKQEEIIESLLNIESENLDFKHMHSINMHSLGSIYFNSGAYQKALGLFEKQKEYLENLVPDNLARTDISRTLSICLIDIGKVYQAKNDIKSALSFYEKSMKTSESLAILEPDRTDRKNDLCLIYGMIGKSYIDIKDLDNALIYFEKSMKVSELLIKNEPSRLDFQLELSFNYENVAGTYFKIGDYLNAIMLLEKSFKILEPLVREYPDRINYKVKLFKIFSFVGYVYQRMGDHRNALDFFMQSLHLNKEIAEQETDQINSNLGLSESYLNVGNTFVTLGDRKKAIEFFEKQTEVLENLVNIEPESNDFKTKSLWIKNPEV